jgi:hypothetical protein
LNDIRPTYEKVEPIQPHLLFAGGCCWCGEEVSCSAKFSMGAKLWLMGWKVWKFLIEKIWAAEKTFENEESLKISPSFHSRWCLQLLAWQGGDLPGQIQHESWGGTDGRKGRFEKIVSSWKSWKKRNQSKTHLLLAAAIGVVGLVGRWFAAQT